MDEEEESKRGQAKTGCEAASEVLVEMLKRKYGVASGLRFQEPSKKKKPRLEAPHQRTYDCCACNTSFSTIEALYDHIPTHRTLLHDQNNMQQDDDDDGGKGKRVYHWK